MTYEGDASPELADVLSRHDGVLSVDSAMKYLTRDALRWRVSSGRWQQPCRGIVVAQSGPLTEFQALRIAALWQVPEVPPRLRGGKDPCRAAAGRGGSRFRP